MPGKILGAGRSRFGRVWRMRERIVKGAPFGARTSLRGKWEMRVDRHVLVEQDHSERSGS